MKKLLKLLMVVIVVTALVMLSGLVSCKAEKETTTEPEIEKGEVTKEEVAEEVSSKEEKITLRLSSWQWIEPGFQDFWNQAIEAFMAENPSITIEPFDYPYDPLWDKLAAEIAAGTPPDLIELTGFNFHQYAFLGVLEPLDEKISGSDVEGAFYDFQKTFPVLNGKTYGVCLSARTLQLVYNKEIFEKAGLDVPTNIDEFKNVATSLTKEEPELQYGFTSVTADVSDLYETILLFVAGNGGNFAKDGFPTANDQKTIEGIQYFKDLFDAGAIPSGADWPTKENWFLEGRAAMTITGPWFYAQLQDYPKTLSNAIFADNPFLNKAATGGPNNVITIAADSPYKEEAWEFIKFITSQEWTNKWVQLTKTASARKGSVNEEFLSQNEWFKVFANNLENAVAVSPPGMEIYYEEFNKIVRSYVMEILYDDKPVEQAMNECQLELENLLQ